MKNLLTVIRAISKRRVSASILGSVLIGLILARFMTLSPLLAIMLLSCGIVLAVTVLLRKTDYLIFSWFILTSLIWLILRLLPVHYFPFVGRGIFWGLLICVIAAWAIDNIVSGRQFVPFNNAPLKGIVLIFLLWCTMTLSTSIDVFTSIKKLSHIIIALVASYMFYDFFSRDQNNIKRLVRILFLLAIVVSFIVVVVAAHSLISGVEIYKQIALWFVNPNSLGIFLFMSIPILITAGFHFVSNRGLRLFFAVTMLLALFFSFARASWLGTSVSIIFLLWKSRMKIPVSMAIITALVLGALLFPVVGGDVYDFITEEQYTGRREIWQAAWKTACHYPLLGTGPGNSVDVMSQYIDTPWLKGQEAHNAYLKNAAEMGFVSVVIVLAFYIIFLYSSEKIEKNLKSDYLKSVARGTTATLLGIAIFCIFENGPILIAFDASEFTVLLPYILISLPFAAKRLEEKAEVAI